MTASYLIFQYSAENEVCRLCYKQQQRQSNMTAAPRSSSGSSTVMLQEQQQAAHLAVEHQMSLCLQQQS